MWFYSSRAFLLLQRLYSVWTRKLRYSFSISKFINKNYSCLYRSNKIISNNKRISSKALFVFLENQLFCYVTNEQLAWLGANSFWIFLFSELCNFLWFFLEKRRSFEHFFRVKRTVIVSLSRSQRTYLPKRCFSSKEHMSRNSCFILISCILFICLTINSDLSKWFCALYSSSFSYHNLSITPSSSRIITFIISYPIT